VTDLPAHQTLSRPFTSKALTELVEQSGNWMHQENAVLWKVRPLLTKFCGDSVWAPCEMMETVNDAELFDDDFLNRYLSSSVKGSTNGDVPRDTPRANGDSSSDLLHHVNGEASKPQSLGLEDRPGGGPPDEDAVRDNSDNAEPSLKEAMDLDEGNGATKAVQDRADQEPDTRQSTRTENPKETAPGKQPVKDNPLATESSKETAKESMETLGQDVHIAGGEPSRAVLPTTSQGGNSAALAVNGSRALSLTPEMLDEPFIHPLFMASRDAHPDRDLGLPEPEAEDVRRLLQLWIHKQEEVARGTNKLNEGLLRADRLRKAVLKWSKAEAHVGASKDMSDGEDWYDKEEWGLTEDLKKGHDEEEEEQQQTQKKTRARR